MSDKGFDYPPPEGELPLGNKGRNEPRFGRESSSSAPVDEDRKVHVDYTRERMDRSYRLQEDEYVPRKPNRAAWAGNMAEQTRRLPIKKIAYGAAGVVGIGVIALGLNSVFTGHRGGIPVFGPPPWPVRTKPVDPGGMKLINVMPTTTDGTGKVVLAPPPEMPHPEELSAQYGQVAKNEQKRVDALAANKKNTASDEEAIPETEGRDLGGTDIAPQSSDTGKEALQSEKAASNNAQETDALKSSESATDQQAEKANGIPASKIENVTEKTTAQPDKTAEAKVASSSTVGETGTGTSSAVTVKPSQKGTYSVQLGALNSLSAAETQWKQISSKLPDLFEGRIPVIQRVKQDRGQFYRLRTKGFATVTEASRFCAKARQAGISCTVANF